LEPKISVLIPVCRESILLERLLTDLLIDRYQSKEILVVIDSPTEMSLSVVEKFQGRVVFILNGERIGKVNALNEAFKRTTGNILLFLDSDVQLQVEGASFLGALANEMMGVDILDIKKTMVKSSFLAKLVYYEYLGSSLVSWFFSKRLGKSLGLNGAAFAIRKEAFERLGGFRRTIPDDFDLITRSFLDGLSFRYTRKISVSVKPHSGWKDWYKQRKRWGIATGVWLKDYYRPLARILVRMPQIMLPGLLLLMPSLLLISLNSLIPDTIYYHMLTLILLVLARYSSLALLPILMITFGISIMENVIVAALTYTMFSSIYYFAARNLGYRFNPAEFLCYYFVYSPLSLLTVVVGIIRVAIYRDMIDLDWKV